jgi:DNA-binding GntR family transcriptional regulator
MRATKGRKTVSQAVSAPIAARDETPSVAARIALKIEEDVVLGRRHPRERLIEQDLSEHFETHRGDVRLALFELEKKGIVERIPNRGAIVRDLTPAEVREVYAVREELEVMAVRVLPMPVSKADVDQLDLLQRDHSRAVAERDLLAVFHSNVRFHRVLYGLCGNTCLIETIEQLAQKVSVIRSSAHANAEALDRARRDHIEIIEALKHSRRDDLIALTRRHLKPAARAYIESYEKRFGVNGA